MRTLTRGQFLAIFGLTSGGFDALQNAGHVALAFGTPIPASPGRYFDLDLVAMAIAAGLAPGLGRQTATAIALLYFDQWASAVGHVDADPTRDYFFAIGCFGWDDRKKRFSEIQVTVGVTQRIMSDLSGASSVIAVNITDIVTRLRTKARAAGIDLSQPFFFPPDHERFSQIITEFEEERRTRIARLRQNKKKWRRYLNLVDRGDIKTAAKFRNSPSQLST
jgi:hypothetical protein